MQWMPCHGQKPPTAACEICRGQLRRKETYTDSFSMQLWHSLTIHAPKLTAIRYVLETAFSLAPNLELALLKSDVARVRMILLQLQGAL
jgi:hypothetical protein